MIAPRTLNELFFGAVDAYAERPVAMRSKPAGAWIDVSYRELNERVRAAAAGLGALGLAAGDRVGILAENRPEWAIADYACLSIRCADVPIYPTLPARQVEHILRDSGAAAIFVSSREQLAKVRGIQPHLPALRHVIAMNADTVGQDVIGFSQLLASGAAAAPPEDEWRREALAVVPDDLATLIYTSGTTGDPKGVMLTHGNIASNVTAALSRLDIGPGDECLSFLPLSHIFERMAGHYCMMAGGAIINYAVSIDTVPQDMADRRPTVVMSVPRLYEKIYVRVLDGVSAGPAIKRRIFHWARRVGETWTEYRLAHRPVPAGLARRYRIANKLVFSKLHARVGGRLRYFFSGGAPLAAEIAKFFYAAGLPILEGYGLTETSPVIAFNTLDAMKLGTVGRAAPGAEIRIASDGEILTRGPHVMKGYYNQPDATAEAIDPDGWFHTGDIGILDAEKFLKITDRKKDIIVTAGGKNIAPQPIENLARSNKFVSNAVMIGDKRKFPIMLIVPNMENLKAWARHEDIAVTDVPALLARPEVMAKMDREVGKTLDELAHFEAPKRLLLMPADFTIEAGELTPTLKVKRRAVEEHNRKRIEAVYAEADKVPHAHGPA